MDDVAFRVANRLVGNDPGTSALECTMSGPTMRFSHHAVSRCGAVMDADLDGAPVAWRTADRRGSRPGVSGWSGGDAAHAYFAVRDGSDVPEYLGRARRSCSADRRARGARLAPGDVLHGETGDPGLRPRGRSTTWCRTARTIGACRVLSGPHADPDFFTDADIAMLHDTEWEVHHHSERTGCA